MPIRPDGGLPEQVLPRLEPYFHIHREVTGTHPTGKRLRIDAIVVPRDPSGWARPDIALGIEFKRAAAIGRGDSSRTIRQCLDYTVVEWPSFGSGIPVFYCPGFAAIEALRSYRQWTPYVRAEDDWFGEDVVPNVPMDRHQIFSAGMGYAISGILGQHNVGELIDHERDGLSFIKHGGGFHVQWSERRGVCEGKINHLRRKIGSG